MTGIVLALFGLVAIFVIIPSGISISDEYGLNPRIFPLTVMWLGTLVAVLLVVQRMREAPSTADEPAPMGSRNWLFIAAMSAFLAATYLGIVLVGFRIVGPIAVALMMAAMGEWRHPSRLVLVSVLLPLGVYYCFDRIFVIQLP
jgi:hypothetical protein